MFKMTASERRAIVGLGFVSALRLVGLFMILPVFSVYANTFSDATPMRVGLALGIYGLFQALFQGPIGFLSDRLGRRPLIILALVIFILGSIVAAQSLTLTGIILGRALQGIGATGSVILALISDLTRIEVRTRAMGLLGMSIGAAFALALLLGPVVCGWVGLSGLFWIAAGLGVLSLIILRIVPKEESVKNHSLPKSDASNALPKFRQIPSILFNPQLFPSFLGGLFLHATLTAIFLKAPIFINSQLSETSTAYFYLPVLSLSFLMTLPLLWFLDKRQKKGVDKIQIILCILLFSEIGMFYAINTLQSIFYFGVCFTLFFIAFNLIEASLPTRLSALSPSNMKGTTLGIYSSLQFLGLFIGGAFGGFLDHINAEVFVWAFCVIMCVLWLCSQAFAFHFLQQKLHRGDITWREV